MSSAPAVLHAPRLTFDPMARVSRCASELNPTTIIQKLLNGGFSNLNGIDMGHKGYFLRLLHLMSYKNKDNDELFSMGQPDPATTEVIYFTHFVPFLPVRSIENSSFRL